MLYPFHIFRKYKVILSIIGFIILSLIILFFSKNLSLSERFSDEINHFVGGHYLLEGKKLYSDYQLNHQPLIYYYSALVELLSSPDSLYYYISFQRLSIALYSITWHGIFLLLFGPVALLLSFIFELNKFTFSGYKLLGETIATYPLIAIFGLFLQQLLFKKEFSKKILIFLSVCIFIINFSLLPLWIVSIPILLYFLWHYKKNRNNLVALLLPGALLTGILFIFVPFKDWVNDTLIYSVNYFLPLTVGMRSTKLEIILIPFYVFLPPYSLYKGIVLGFFSIIALNTFVLFKEKELYVLAFLIFFLYASNLRVGDKDFGSFHLFPWFGILSISAIILTTYLFSKKKYIKFQLYTIAILAFILIESFIHPTLYQLKNLTTEYYNNYSESETYGDAIYLLKDDNDRLIVVPVDSLIYWEAQIEPGTHLLEYYPWVYPIPEYQYDVQDVFISNPPEFFINVGLNQSDETEKFIQNIVVTQYVQINHVGKPSKLYILNSKMTEITDKQWKELEGKLFTRP